MFESAELGRKVSKKEYAEREQDIHVRLLAAQRKLREADFPVILVVAGVEGAGKGGVVNQLSRWLDTRGIRTTAFWDESDEERERPRFWRYWRQLPPKGSIGIMFGSWYTQPIVNRAIDGMDDASFEHELARIRQFEQALAHDGALLIKFWFHLSKKLQQKRLEQDRKQGRKGITAKLLKDYSKHYDSFVSVCEHALRETDSSLCPWHIVEASDVRYKNLSVGATLLSALESRLESPPVLREAPAAATVSPDTPSAAVTVLDRVDLSAKLDRERYSQRLAKCQRKLSKLAWKTYQQKRNCVAIFEGWDAAGKGGAIRRLTAPMDARLYRVISIAAPTDEERSHHYLWRFWRHLPRAGHVTVYDRSWYGRVLVERVEQFAQPHEWRRAYLEINQFEEALVDDGIILLKFWLHLSQEEQLRRFKEREQVPWKQHKLTEEDWRNRDKWDDYAAAVNDMIRHTSTEYAPWSLVAGNDKYHARVSVLDTVCRALERALDK
jgi:polyphosphate:AMP phosphotransferase